MYNSNELLPTLAPVSKSAQHFLKRTFWLDGVVFNNLVYVLRALWLAKYECMLWIIIMIKSLLSAFCSFSEWYMLGFLPTARVLTFVGLCAHLISVASWPSTKALFLFLMSWSCFQVNLSVQVLSNAITCFVSLAAAGTAKASQKTAPQKNVGSRGSPSSSLQKLPSLSSALPATAGPSTTGAWKGSPNASTPATRSSAASSTVRTTSKTTKERTYGFLFVLCFVVVVLLHPLQALHPSPFTPHPSPITPSPPNPLTPHPSPFTLRSFLFTLRC